MIKDNYCIIMAGGVGSRFWPLSKTSKPKQFLDIFGTGKSLLQQTFERFLPLCPQENIFIVSNLEYRDIIKEQLPDLKDFQILLEPMRKNTAPCIAFANYRIQKVNPTAQIIVAPSDHLIIDDKLFLATLKKGLNFVKKNNALLTLGIVPSRPETGYGYIQKKRGVVVKGDNHLRKVKTFTEKPNIDLAQAFVESGEFYWNSGIFIWSLKSIQNAFSRFLPEIFASFSNLNSEVGSEREKNELAAIYAETRNISVDYGIMEKADNVYVYGADFGWSDLGTWSSLYQHSGKDEKRNAVLGEDVILYNSSGCVINNPGDKLLVIEGLKDYVVVESEKALLICRIKNEQLIKQMVNDVLIRKGEDYV